MKTSIVKFSSSKIIAPLVLAAGMLLACASNVQAVHLDYANTVGSLIHFDGMTHFTFSPGANNFMITSPGISAGLLGEMTGTYTIGTITVNGITESAPVTGSGTFVIHDGSGFNLTATLTWIDITQVGQGGNLNISGQVNLTGISYSGSNADLIALRNAGSAVNTLTFQTQVDLFGLRDGPGTHDSSFSGSIQTLPDGGTTVALLGLALTGLEGLRRGMKKAKARI